jgi:hypothetical protein
VQTHNILDTLCEVLDIFDCNEFCPGGTADFVEEEDSFDDGVPVYGEVS